MKNRNRIKLKSEVVRQLVAPELRAVIGGWSAAFCRTIVEGTCWPDPDGARAAGGNPD